MIRNIEFDNLMKDLFHHFGLSYSPGSIQKVQPVSAAVPPLFVAFVPLDEQYAAFVANIPFSLNASVQPDWFLERNSLLKQTVVNYCLVKGDNGQPQVMAQCRFFYAGQTLSDVIEVYEAFNQEIALCHTELCELI
ncbi:hypothetical protein SG34_032240 [Thalassomonas viridans]|uniref:Uncharacterized protein n=1 Tax=Thalassomonas viridans TaxID=137584 RepID=A0AAF0CCP5_9GAMM|nr:hypothetical protein [Thalassomonas viridans]WDE08593.1 hypothetical protein SG34_032240 [Thalassomonas viridans]